MNKQISNEQVQAVYEAMRNRQIHPDGKFDNAGRWYPSEAECIGLANIRSPSRNWPYSYLVACRTRKHVKLIAENSPELFMRHLAKLLPN